MHGGARRGGRRKATAGGQTRRHAAEQTRIGPAWAERGFRSWHTRPGRTGSALLSVVSIVSASLVAVAAMMPSDTTAAVHQAAATVPQAVRTVPQAALATPAIGSQSSAQGSTVQNAVARKPVPTNASRARYGIDIAYPQCGRAMPDISLDFAVLGVTHGRASTSNPCLAEQAAWARSQHLRIALYVVPSTPDSSTALHASRTARCAKTDPVVCRAYRAGVLQARHALGVARAARVITKSWWLDVEETPDQELWSGNDAINVAVLKGWVSALRKAKVQVGVYSTGGYWTMITDDWDAHLPQWVAVGSAGVDGAREACGRPFTSGPVVMTQWLTGPFDGNLLCAGGKPAARRATDTMAGGLSGHWHRPRTVGVPSLLTIPVPHPDQAAQQALAKAAEKQAAKIKKAKAKQAKLAKLRLAKEKARRAKLARERAQAHPKPPPSKPAPKPTPKPDPKPSPSPSPTPSAPATGAAG